MEREDIKKIAINTNRNEIIFLDKDNKRKTLDLHRTVLGVTGDIRFSTAKGGINIEPINGIMKCEYRGGDYWTQVYHCEAKQEPLWKIETAHYNAKPRNTVFESKEEAMRVTTEILNRFPYTKVRLLKENKRFEPYSTYTIDTKTGKIRRIE